MDYNYDPKFPVSVGRIVLFRLDNGTAAEAGGNSAADDLVPAIVVSVWNAEVGYVNLKVITDSSRNLWVTSVSYGAGQRQWQWPPRV